MPNLKTMHSVSCALFIQAAQSGYPDNGRLEFKRQYLPILRNTADVISHQQAYSASHLSYRGPVTHICVSTPGHNWFRYNGWSPARQQAIIWTNADILSIRTLGTYISKKITSKFKKCSFNKMYRPFCLGLNVLIRAVSICYGLKGDFSLNTLRPRQNGRHFADDILKCIFLNENVWIPIEFSLKFVPKGPIDNIPAFV